MRIALVNDYSLAHIGGAVTSMLEQKRALEAAGHTVKILQLGKAINSDPDIIWIAPTLTLTGALYNLPFLFPRNKHDTFIKKILKDERIDVVHTQSEMTLAHLVTKNARELEIPVFFTIHTMFWEYKGPIASATAGLLQPIFERAFRQKIKNYHPTGNSLEKLLKNITLHLAAQTNGVFSPSAHQKKTIEATHLKTPVYVVPNPFSASAKKAMPVSPKPHIPRFVWVGRCVNEKRPLEFLQAVEQAMATSKQPFKVEVIGDGALLGTMKARYASKGITFHGHIAHKETVKIMDQSDVICLSSYHFDNQPMVIAEAISRSRPVLYCDERLTEGVDIAGYLTKDETPTAMAAGIVDLVEHPEKIIELSKKAEEAASIFTPETFAKTVTTYYQVESL